MIGLAVGSAGRSVVGWHRASAAKGHIGMYVVSNTISRRYCVVGCKYYVCKSTTYCTYVCREWAIMNGQCTARQLHDKFLHDIRIPLNARTLHVALTYTTCCSVASLAILLPYALCVMRWSVGSLLTLTSYLSLE